uniref:Nucleotidyl transferase AbiEii/AbiGii toxin family protein n=1 Tax=Geladintestivirus 5 TaxID=3233137 RepID=A0AAU8MH15_9CAUD
MKRNDIKIKSHVNKIIMINNVIKFTLECVPDIMNYFGFDETEYAIGGSMAGILYGIDFNRYPHDIDIIVPFGMCRFIKDIVNRSCFFREDNLTSSIDTEWGTNHYAFKTVKGFTIDIIEDIDFNNDTVQKEMISIYNTQNNKHKTLQIMGINSLINAKSRYNREKDKTDLMLLTAFRDTYFPNIEDIKEKKQDTTLSDLESLTTLKAKIEKEF